ncbi:MAG: universal stress protein, partial [Acaryochloridaceae cyanobacterium CSU_5_19]|nr:universal stress protein [Acaryochloridaceae cyanobacterium CSU_5_19]
SREQNANLVVMGWSRTSGLRARLFGNVIDSIFWSSHCPVAVTRFLESPTSIQRILVPVENLNQSNLRSIQFAKVLAIANEAQITLLHVCNRYVSTEQIHDFEIQLAAATSQDNQPLTLRIKTIADDDVAKVILKEAVAFDLVVLHAIRQRTAVGLAISDITTQVINELSSSMVLIAEPCS